MTETLCRCVDKRYLISIRASSTGALIFLRSGKMKKRYAVWIYDEESGFDSPMICLASDIVEARRLGRDYIRKWNLVGAEIVKVEMMDGGERTNE